MDSGEIFVWINEHAIKQDNEVDFNDFVLRAKRVVKVILIIYYILVSTWIWVRFSFGLTSTL